MRETSALKRGARGRRFCHPRLPIHRRGERRSINGMIDALQQVVSQLPPDVKVIPGHGPVSNLDDVRAYLGMLKETRDAVQKAFESGQDSRPDEAG